MKITGKDGISFVEMLAAIALLAVLVAIAWGKFNTSFEEALEATLVSELRNLATAQEVYYRNHVTYTTDLTALSLAESPKSEINITSADVRGWAAWNRIDKTLIRCEVYTGNGHTSPLGFAETPENITCDKP
jgi:Tfp pilus assembly protein PilE